MITRYRRKKGFRDKRQREIYNRHHRTLEELLKKATNGITREELYLKTGFSRRIITKHVRDFGGNIRREKRRLFWAQNYERYEKLRRTIDNVSRIIMKVGLDPKGLLEDSVLVLSPNKSGVYFFSPEDKELIQMISQRAMYVGKVTRRRKIIYPAALNDIWIEEGFI